MAGPGSDAAIRRGVIYGIAPEEDRGSVPPIPHPYVVVQDDLFNASRIGTVIVCGITSNQKRVAEPGTVLLEESEGGLTRTVSWWHPGYRPFRKCSSVSVSAR